jgi:small-conductance mechanosensitive channel
MFRDLRTRVSGTRRTLAWVLLLLLTTISAFVLPRLSTSLHPAWLNGARILFWTGLALLSVRLATFVLIDPLLRERKSATPGFARDLLVLSLYGFVIGGVLKEVVGISLTQLLGTGAIAAAIVGLSLQETLGNLFAGISLHMDPAFQEGDWIEITGPWRGGPGRETIIGQVVCITWRTVQLKNDFGDMDIIPNRLIAQAIVTNLYAPTGLHKRSFKLAIAPNANLHVAIEKLTTALSGIPHFSHQPPEVVVCGSDLGGAVLECRYWTLGWRDSRNSLYLAARLANSVLPREGFPLLGPHGSTSLPTPETYPVEAQMQDLVALLQLPSRLSQDLRPSVLLRHLGPGEGVIREGDPGNSIFAVVSGSLIVVKVAERAEPYNGIFWDTIATLGPGDWFGEASLLTGAPRNATVVTDTACEILEVPKAAFEACLKREPDLVHHLVDLMEARAKESDALDTANRKSQLREVWLKQIKTWFGLA